MSYHLSAGPYDRNTFNDIYDDVKGSLPMYSVHEALARDRMREAEQRSFAEAVDELLMASTRTRSAARSPPGFHCRQLPFRARALICRVRHSRCRWISRRSTIALPAVSKRSSLIPRSSAADEGGRSVAGQAVRTSGKRHPRNFGGGRCHVRLEDGGHAASL